MKAKSIHCFVAIFQGYESSQLKIGGKNGKTSSVSNESILPKFSEHLLAYIIFIYITEVGSESPNH